MPPVLDVSITGNHIFGQTASGDVGLDVGTGTIAKNNDVYGNFNGIYIENSSASVTGNRIFSNSNSGVVIGNNGGVVIGNRIYSNKTGISGTPYSFQSYDIENNLIYTNTSAGIDITGGGATAGAPNKIIGNTIYQSVGSAVRLSTASINAILEDNILWSDLGTILSVSADSLTGFNAGYNLYYRGTAAAATLVAFGGSTLRRSRRMGSRGGDAKCR